MARPEINRTVGQPPMESPVGRGVPSPDIQHVPPSEHPLITRRRFLVGLGVAGLATSLAIASGRLPKFGGGEIVPSPTPEGTPESTPSNTPELTISPSPEVSPSPTPSAEPTPTPTPSPVATPEITPTPTPEATLMPISSIIEGKHPKPSVKTVTADIKTTLEKNPEALSDGGTVDGYLTVWTYCQKGDPNFGGDPYTNKESNCGYIIVAFYQHYQNLKNESFYKLADEVYDYAANTLPKDYINGLKKSLEEIF